MSEQEWKAPNTENVPAKQGRDMIGAVCWRCGQADHVDRMIRIDNRHVCLTCAKKVM